MAAPRPAPGFFPGPPFPSQIPQLWNLYNYVVNLAEGRPPIGRNQIRALISQLKGGIDAAAQREQQVPGGQETQELINMLNQLRFYFEPRQRLDWIQLSDEKEEYTKFLGQIAQALDNLLARFTNMLGIRFQSTVGLVQQARAQDDGWFDTFVNSVDSAAPAPAGEFSSAYQRRDFAQVNAMANSVLQSQSSMLSKEEQLVEEQAKKASELTKWLLNITKQKLPPQTILTRHIIGEWVHIASTPRHQIYTAEYISGIKVAIKVPQDLMQGEDPKATILRFQRSAELWHSLRYDWILPFHGIGKKEHAGRTQVFCVSPYYPHGDAVTYQRDHECTIQDNLQIALDVASALRYLHVERDNPVVHFNVSTENVLIDQNGRGVLGGFGFSKEISPSEGTITPRPTNLPPRNDTFQAPEYYNDPTFRHKTSADVWGWSMTALQLVGGEAPFCEAPSDFHAVTMMVRGERPDRKYYPGIKNLVDPDSFWGLLTECWDQEELKRPTMDEVALRMRQIRDQNQLGRRDPPVVPAPAPRRQPEATSSSPTDGQKTQGVTQGRGPPPQGGRR